MFVFPRSYRLCIWLYILAIKWTICADCNGGNGQDKILNLPGYPSDAPILTMYSGFVEVNATANGSLFYWLIESLQTNKTNIPVVIWLNGGPGASSLTGLFMENGPFTIDSGNPLQLNYNNYSWTNYYHLLYIDNPIGTGFAFCDNNSYVTNEDNVGAQFVEFLYQFFNPLSKCHPELFSNPLFITGESFAGKYIPFITKWWIKETESVPTVPLPQLKGIAIGDGSYNPFRQYPAVASYAYNLGIIDENIYQQTLDEVNYCLYNLTDSNMSMAVDYCLNVTNSVYSVYGGNILQYNVYILDGNYYDSMSKNIGIYLSNVNVEKAIHTFNISTWKSSDGTSAPNPVYDALKNDILLNNTAGIIPDILANHIRILFYNGQLDGGRCNNYGTQACLNEFNYNGDWKSLERHVVKFKDDNLTSGYVKQTENKLLTYFVASDSGHMVPLDQPLNALEMIHTFIENTSWF